MRLAHALHDAKDTKSAVQVFIDAQKNDPWPLTSHYRFRNVLQIIPNSPVTKNVLEVIKTIRIDSPATAYMVGSIFMAVQDLNAAKKSYESGLALFPQSLELIISVIEILILQKCYADAQYQIKIALNNDQANDVAFLKLGQFALNLRNFRLAGQCFKKCIQIDPENKKAHMHIMQIKAD